MCPFVLIGMFHWHRVSFAGGPKLRKWYGAPDLLPKDGGFLEEEDESPGKIIAIFECSFQFQSIE